MNTVFPSTLPSVGALDVVMDVALISITGTTSGTPGSTSQLTAVLKDAQGNTLSRSVSWATMNPDVALVDNSGKVTFLQPGQAAIVARAAGASDAVIAGNAKLLTITDPAAPASTDGDVMMFSAERGRFEPRPVPIAIYPSLESESGVVDLSLPYGNVRRYGADNNGVINAAPAFVSANGSGETITVVRGVYKIAEDLTITGDIAIEQGALISPNTGVTVTIDAASLRAGDYQWIDPTAGGKVVFTQRTRVTLNASWFGLKADWNWVSQTGTDNAAVMTAIENALSLVTSDTSIGWDIQFPSGGFRTSVGLRTQQHATFLRGRGVGPTRFVFDPEVDGKVAVEFSRDDHNSDGIGDELFGGGLENIVFYSPNTNDRQKTAVKLVDMSEPYLDKVQVTSTFTSHSRSSTNPSVGIHVQGREFFRLFKSSVFADRPVWIDSNPNYPAGVPDLRIDCDVFHFQDIYLGCLEPSEACLTFGNGVTGLNLQNFVLDGSNCWVGPGKNFIRYVTPAGQSWHSNRSVRIENLRSEGVTDDSGWFLDIQGDTGFMTGLMVKNCQPAATNGIRLRGITGVTLEDIHYTGAAAHARNLLDVNETCDVVTGRNCYFAKAANNGIALGELRKVAAIGDTSITAIEPDFWLASTANRGHMKLFGTDPDLNIAAVDLVNTSATGTDASGFRIVAGVPGLSNQGFTIRRLSDSKNVLRFLNGVFNIAGAQIVLEEPGGNIQMTSPDGTTRTLSAPNAAGAAVWT